MQNMRARTPAEYLAALPPDRRKELSRVRQVVRQHLPAGYREVMNWGHITYEVPASRYPVTYNGQPLCYAALGAQKNHLALYLMGLYASPSAAKQFKDSFKKAGKTLDMGKSCVRFKTADDLPLAVVGRAIAAAPLKKYIAFYEANRPGSARALRSVKSARKKAAGRGA